MPVSLHSLLDKLIEDLAEAFPHIVQKTKPLKEFSIPSQQQREQCDYAMPFIRGATPWQSQAIATCDFIDGTHHPYSYQSIQAVWNVAVRCQKIFSISLFALTDLRKFVMRNLDYLNPRDWALTVINDDTLKLALILKSLVEQAIMHIDELLSLKLLNFFAKKSEIIKFLELWVAQINKNIFAYQNYEREIFAFSKIMEDLISGAIQKIIIMIGFKKDFLNINACKDSDEVVKIIMALKKLGMNKADLSKQITAIKNNIFNATLTDNFNQVVESKFSDVKFELLTSLDEGIKLLNENLNDFDFAYDETVLRLEKLKLELSNPEVLLQVCHRKLDDLNLEIQAQKDKQLLVNQQASQGNIWFSIATFFIFSRQQFNARQTWANQVNHQCQQKIDDLTQEVLKVKEEIRFVSHHLFEKRINLQHQRDIKFARDITECVENYLVARAKKYETRDKVSHFFQKAFKYKTEKDKRHEFLQKELMPILNIFENLDYVNLDKYEGMYSYIDNVINKGLKYFEKGELNRLLVKIHNEFQLKRRELDLVEEMSKTILRPSL